MEKLEQVRHFFAADRFATEAAGAVIEEIGERYARCSMELSQALQNAAGATMGGAIYTLADFTFAVAVNQDGPIAQTLCAQINFLSVPRGHKLSAEATCIKDGRSTCCYLVTLTDDTGRTVATVTCTGFKKTK